jgi:uncharacterized protein
LNGQTLSQISQEFNPNIADWIGLKNDRTKKMSPKTGRNACQITTDIKVRVVPRSSRNQIIGLEDGVYKIKLTAPPVDGKANKALREFLAKRLGLARRSVEITSGERSRQKLVRIHGLPLKEVSILLGI